MKQWHFKTSYFPLILLLVSVLSYGILIPWLGFYWDDWPYAYLNHLLGPTGFPTFVASDRPFSAWIFMATTWLFGEHPLGYHLLALVLRWLTAVLVWWSLRQVWPKRSREIGWIALLFAVYPGFKQQPIALIYNHHFSVLALFLLSLGGMILAVRKPKWYWPLTILSMAGAASMFSIEYFFGLEFLRPIFLWLVIGETTAAKRTRLKQTLLHWLPYLAVMVTFLVWRVFIFKFPTYQPDLITAAPQALPETFFPKVVRELFSAGLLAWITTVFPQGLSSAGIKATLVYAALVGASTILLVFFLVRSETSPTKELDNKEQRQWGIQCTIIGLLALVSAGIPTWVNNLPVRLLFPWDRLTLVFMIRSSMFLVALL